MTAASRQLNSTRFKDTLRQHAEQSSAVEAERVQVVPLGLCQTRNRVLRRNTGKRKGWKRGGGGRPVPRYDTMRKNTDRRTKRGGEDRMGGRVRHGNSQSSYLISC